MKQGAVIALSTRVDHLKPLPVRVPDASPFLKWVGGKGKLARTLQSLLPPGVSLMRHVEPFVGGGAMLFFI